MLDFIILFLKLHYILAGLGFPSSIASMLLPIKVEATNLRLFVGRNRFLFQLQGSILFLTRLVAPSNFDHLTRRNVILDAVPHPKSLHAQPPLHYPSTRGNVTKTRPQNVYISLLF